MLKFIPIVFLVIAAIFFVFGIINKNQNFKKTSKKFLGAAIGFAVGLLIVYMVFVGGINDKGESSNFTNKFGTPDTVCAHSGCSNKIASSGDTNCCVSHSKGCGECGCYIDEDALFCMSCIEKAVKK